MKPVSLNLRRCFSRLFGLKEPAPDAGSDGANPFQALFDRLPDPVWIIVGSNFVDANPAALKAMGLVDKASALKRHPADLSPECQPDGERSHGKAERMMAIAREQGLHRFEWVHRRPDGSAFWVEVTLNTFDWRGQPALCCRWRDLAERQRLRAALEEREAHYERVASTVPLLLYDYVMYPDETDRFLFVGPKCREILEIDPKVLEADSSALWSRVHPEDLVRVQEEKVIAFRARSDYFSTEFRITTPSGRWKWLHVGSRPGPETDQGVPVWSGFMLDITAQKSAEASLRFYQYAVERSADAAIWLDARGHFVYVNPAACALYGRTQAELLTLVVTDLDALHDAEFWRRHWEELTRKGSLLFETRLVDAAGRTFPVEVRDNHVVFDGQEYNCAFVRDITDRKRIEEELQHTREGLEATLNALPDLMFRVDRSGRILDYHTSMMMPLYQPPEVFLGRSVTEVLPDTAAHVIMTALGEADRAGWSRGATYSLPLPEGPAWYELSIAAMNRDESEVATFVVLARDITQRKAAEAAYQHHTVLLEAAQQAARIGYFVTDLRTRRWTSSTMFDEIMGIDEHFQRDVEHWVRLVHPDDCDRACQEFEQAVRQGEPLHHRYRIIRPDDHRVCWVDARGSYEYEQGQPVRLIGTVQDVTEIMAAQSELERHRDQLELIIQERTEALLTKALELQKANKRLQLAIEATRFGIWEWDCQAQALTWSIPAFGMLGYEPNEIENTREAWLNLVHPDDRSRVASDQVSIDKETGRFEIDFRLRAKDGGYRWFQDRGWLTGYDSAGQPERVVGTIIDITDRKLVELALVASEREAREQRQRLANVIWGTGVGTWEWDIPQSEITIDERWAQMLGYVREELKPFTLETWSSRVHPDDLALASASLQSHFLQELEYYECEMRMRHRDGHWVWILDRGRVNEWSPDGLPLWMSGTHTDITVRKKAELALAESHARLRKLAERVPGTIYQYQLNPDGTSCFPYASEGIRDVYRVTPEQVREDASAVFAILHPEDLDRIVASIQESVATGHIWQLEYRVKFDDGTVYWLLGNATPERQADGGTLWHGYIHDITERKRIEQEITELNVHLERRVAERTAELAAANAAKTQFLGHMSHELRTPMNAVIGLTQLLERMDLPQEPLTMVQQIRESGNIMMSIVNDILDFGKIEAGQLAIERQPFSPLGVIDRVQALLSASAAQKGLELRVEDRLQMTENLLGDALRIEQILLNLTGNAIKFTERGGVTVSLARVEGNDAEVRLRFEVSDTGPGITEEQLGQLFRPFSQGDASITRRFGGTGLGLVISRRLAEMMGGVLGVASQVGAGSTFWFEIPLAWAPAQAQAADAGPETVDTPGPHLAGLRVLAVDDSRINLLVVKKALQQAGVSVSLAADGQEALQILRAQPTGFDAVLMDVQMPVMDGLTATREIRRDARLAHLPVIALTAGVLPEERQAALEAGVDDFLAKPMDLGQLNAVLARFSGGRATKTTKPD